MPMTEPPENATLSALFMPPVRAALAVRTFALVATRIPKKPASIEKHAPMTKQTAVPMFMNMAISTNKTTINIASILYSARRKALAPSAIAAAISCIRLFPGSHLLT